MEIIKHMERVSAYNEGGPQKLREFDTLQKIKNVDNTCERCRVALATHNYHPGWYPVCDSCHNVLDHEKQS